MSVEAKVTYTIDVQGVELVLTEEEAKELHRALDKHFNILRDIISPVTPPMTQPTWPTVYRNGGVVEASKATA